MARDFARSFYKSKAWLKTRQAYIQSVDGLCERCLTRGIVKPGVIVHHKVHLNPQNIHNPDIALGFDNLELVCRDCHAKEHPEIYGVDKFQEPRVMFDIDGNIMVNPWSEE